MAREKTWTRSAFRFVRRPRVWITVLGLLCIYVFLQSPPLWFVRLLPSEIPCADPGGDRVLVIAPHPDDDILGVGSSIAAFREQGIPVVVVFLTSGDANVAGQWLVTMNPFLFASEFRAIGQRRQKEAVVALGRLGVAPSNAIFLNYPDRGLMPLLETHWSALDPFCSPYTNRETKYSAVALNPGGAYCGEALAGELEMILCAFRPSIVYLPHPQDRHEDHRAGYTFVRHAVAAAATNGDLAPPSLRCYLVHSFAPEPWPTPSPIRNVLTMEPLDAFLGLGTWHSMPLPAETIEAKYRALKAHASQWWTCGTFLSRFVCSNELYMVEDT